MHRPLVFSTAVSLLAAASVAAQTPAPAPAPAPAATATVARVAAAEPQLRVHEDDNVRIEELQVRGETERVQVRHKHQGLLAALPRDYEIVTATRGRDLSQTRGAVGQRVWSFFSF